MTADRSRRDRRGFSTCNHTESAEVDPTWIIKKKNIKVPNEWIQKILKNTIDLNPLLSIAKDEGLSAQPRKAGTEESTTIFFS